MMRQGAIAQKPTIIPFLKPTFINKEGDGDGHKEIRDIERKSSRDIIDTVCHISHGNLEEGDEDRH
jgi:hypothetical protein